MGLSDLFKSNSKKSKMTELDVLHVLQAGAPFGVVLPGFKTVRTGVSTSTSYSQDGIRQTVYHSAPTQKVPNSIFTFIKLTETQIIIQHALSDGRHVFINRNSIRYVTRNHKEAFAIELTDGRVYAFGISDKKLKKEYEKEGFNPTFVIDVFHNLLTGVYERQYQQIMTQKKRSGKCPKCNTPVTKNTDNKTIMKCPKCGYSFIF